MLKKHFYFTEVEIHLKSINQQKNFEWETLAGFITGYTKQIYNIHKTYDLNPMRSIQISHQMLLRVNYLEKKYRQQL